MKTLLLTITIMTMTSFALHTAEKHAASITQLGELIIAAAQKQSTTEYLALLPTVEEFHQLMDKNSAIYGANLQAAKEEFEVTYREVFVPAAAQSFTGLLEAGKREGINWSRASFVRAESAERDAHTVRATIHIIADGKPYEIGLDQALVINGHWTVGQTLRLR